MLNQHGIYVNSTFYVESTLIQCKFMVVGTISQDSTTLSEYI